MNTEKNNFIKKAVIAGIALFAGAGLAFAATSIPLNPGNAPQPVTEIQIGALSLSGPSFNASEPNTTSSFAKPDNLSTFFGNLVVTGSTWLRGNSTDTDLFNVTPAGVWQINSGGSAVDLPQATMNIDGTFLSTSLDNPFVIGFGGGAGPVLQSGSTPAYPLCVTADGSIVRCSDPAWYTGNWSTCAGIGVGNRTRTVQCKQAGNVVANTQCSGTMPSTTKSC